MKTIIFAVVAALAPLVFCYDEFFDKMDIDKIMADDTLFMGYLNCAIDKGPCDLDNAAEVKKYLPEMLATKCEKCSSKLKTDLMRAIAAIAEKHPDLLKAFTEKYPTKQQEGSFTYVADDNKQ